jgi:predicted nucleic acid-binding protein
MNHDRRKQLATIADQLHALRISIENVQFEEQESLTWRRHYDDNPAMEVAAEQMTTALVCIDDAVRALEDAQEEFHTSQIACP